MMNSKLDEFLLALERNPELAASVKAASTIDQVIEFAAGFGIQIAPDDLQDSDNRELEDSQLEQAVGGRTVADRLTFSTCIWNRGCGPKF
jgi:predicted ribosomally synthesized peptide with nif11-like leader